MKTDNSVFLVRSKQPEKLAVRTAFRRYGVVPYHDYIKGTGKAERPATSPRRYSATTCWHW